MKTANILIFLAAILGVPTTLSAQDDINGRLDVSATYTGMLVSPYSSFDQFSTGFNTYNRVMATGADELKGFGYAQGYSLSLTQRHQGIWLGLSYDQMFVGTGADLPNNERQQFNLKWHQINVEIGGGKSFSKAYIFLVGGFGAGRIRLYSSYTYSDGTRSYGSDKPWNGVFSSLLMRPYLALKSGFSLNEKLSLGINLGYHFPTGFKFGLDDQNVEKTLTLTPRGQSSLPAGKPGQTSTEPKDYMVNSFFGGPSLSIGLQYTFLTY